VNVFRRAYTINSDCFACVPGLAGDKGGFMNNYVLLAACLLLGVLLRRSGRLPANAAASLNGFVVHISLPALTLAYVHGLKLNAYLILPALMAWVMFALGCGFFWLVGRALRFSRATTGGLMLTGGLANTSFIGLPMIETFYGPQFLGLGILIDQFGLLLRTFDPRHSSRLALRLRSTRKRQGGRQKDRAVRAVSGVCPGSVAHAA
jgi:hypothetical protein